MIAPRYIIKASSDAAFNVPVYRVIDTQTGRDVFASADRVFTEEHCATLNRRDDDARRETLDK